MKQLKERWSTSQEYYDIWCKTQEDYFKFQCDIYNMKEKRLQRYGFNFPLEKLYEK